MRHKYDLLAVLHLACDIPELQSHFGTSLKKPGLQGRVPLLFPLALSFTCVFPAFPLLFIFRLLFMFQAHHKGA